ncbi:MAG: hypothetical protein JOZ75_11710 [Candidatus Dormibacteraeota bacterium]|nr:hypothetical protein [Candidatus Dormibacteraeota bacterium]
MTEPKWSEDWSDEGVDWRDATKDASMARDWIANERLYRGHGPAVPAGYNMDLDARVLELVLTDLDPERGWSLVLMFLGMTEDEEDFKTVAIGPLETFVREHGDAFYDRIDERVQADEAFRRAVMMTITKWPGPHSRPPE